MKVSLGTRIFALTALVVALAVGAAVAVTYFQGERIANETARQALDRANSVQAVLQQQRLDQLGLIARIFAGDVALTSYVAEAIDSGDSLSVLDQLESRQEDLGFDFGIILDGDGFLVARTDDPEATGDDLADRPLVALALDEFTGSGVWEQDGDLYHAVAVPLSVDRLLIGFFIAGFAIDDITAVEIGRTSETDVAFLSRGPDGLRLVASTLQPANLADQLMSELVGHPAVGRVMDDGQAAQQFELELSGARWIALMRPLEDADGGAVGGALALTSLQEQLQPFQRIEKTVVAVGLAAILLASLLSFLLSQRVMRPVRQLAKVANAASSGNYDQKVAVSRTDEVGQLAGSIDSLLSDLREKQDMESYIGNLSRSLGASADEKPIEPPVAREQVLMAVELRGYALGKVTADPEDTLGSLGRDLRRIARSVEERKGRIEGVFGHRLVASFTGVNGGYRALSAATELSKVLTADLTAFDDVPAPIIGIVRGETVAGSVVWGEGPQRMVVGRPFLFLDGLLREATPGDIALSPDLHEELADTFARAGLKIQPQRGILGSQTLYVVRSDTAARVTGEVPVIDPGMDHHATSAIQVETLSQVAPGKVLGDRFEILGTLGAGGMGVVYKVRDRELDDLVALKMLKQTVFENPEQLERLKSELKLARKITHPNVLRTFDFGEINGLPFISMEFVRGITLRQVLDETGSLPYSAGLRLARQLCRGLQAAHAVGVLHRDIKPENLIVEANGNAKLMDFGIARPIVREGMGHTQEGFAVGTPQYMAPEQLQGKPVDQRVDLFAVGVVLYEIFTNRVPFQGANPMEVMMATIQEEATPPSAHWEEIPPDLEKIILRCLIKDPAGRYPDASGLLNDLEKLRA